MNIQRRLSSLNPRNLIDFLTRLYAITPLINAKTIWGKIISKFYVTIFSLGLIYFLYYELQLKAVLGASRKSKKAPVVTIFSTVILFATSISIGLSVVIFQNRRYAYMLDRIRSFRKIISPYFKHDPNRKYVVINVILVHFWYGIVTMDDFTISASGSIRSVHLYIYDSYLRYRLLIFTVYLYFLLKELLDYLKVFNKILKECGENGDGLSLFRLRGDFKKLFTDICDGFVEFNEIVLCFNDVFGWSLLFLLLQYFYIYLVLSNSITSLIAGFKVHWSYSANVIMLLIYATVGAVSIASICDRTTRESRKTAALAYHLLHDLNLKKNKPEERSIEECLVQLIKQTTHRCPAFSAADFFPVDYSTLFVLMNLLASYVVVLIQFE